MAYGIIENGVVTNAVEADADFAAAQGWVALTGGAGIGWKANANGTFSPPVIEPEPAPRHITYKADVWRRATDEQAAMIDTELTKLDVRMRRLWDDSTALYHDAPEFQLLFQTMANAFTEEEAARILAPSDV